jgi:hypothetical protein
MKSTVTIEIPAGSEALVRQLLALQEEMNALALSAPDGTVLDACEEAVIPKGRDLVAKVLSDAVARRIESAEKRGPRSASASAAAPRKIAGSRVGSTSRPSAS